MADASIRQRPGDKVSDLQPSKSSEIVTFLAENGINDEEPVNLTQLAENFAELVVTEKQKNQAAVTKNNLPTKTSHPFKQDNNASFMAIYSARLKAMTNISIRRRLGDKVSVLQPSKNSSMINFLAENGINYEKPLNPMQIAANRNERIARKKRKNQAAVVKSPIST